MNISDSMNDSVQQSLEEVISIIMQIPDDEFTSVAEMMQAGSNDMGDMVSPESVWEAINQSGLTPEQYQGGIEETYQEYQSFIEGLPDLSKEKRDYLVHLVGESTEQVLKILNEKTYIKELTVKVELGDEAQLPQRNTITDACDDLYTNEEITIAPFSKALVGTGLKMVIPAGYEGQIRLRSGIAVKTPLMLANGVGTIDSDYKGEVKIAVVNISNQPYTVEKGTRIAQIKISPIFRVKWDSVTDISKIGDNRGGGFGSSGMKEMK